MIELDEDRLGEGPAVSGTNSVIFRLAAVTGILLNVSHRNSNYDAEPHNVRQSGICLRTKTHCLSDASKLIKYRDAEDQH